MKLDLKCFAKINVNNHIKVLTFKSTLIIFLICPSNSSLDAPISESLTCDSWPSLLPLLCASRTPCGYLMLALIMLYYGDIYNFFDLPKAINSVVLGAKSSFFSTHVKTVPDVLCMFNKYF